MKRKLALILVFAMLFALVACNKQDDEPTEGTNPIETSSNETTAATAEPTIATTEATEPTETVFIPNNGPVEYIPSQDPTEAPTQKPTQAPTQKPTQAPTQKPTQAPTQKPTQAPTQKPTQAPTQKPTQAATQKPTQTPTQKPTQAATQAPTEVATQKPTQAPENPGKVRFVSELKARYSAGEVNGYSLWSKKNPDTYVTTRYCVDYNGYVVFEFSESERSETNVKNNAFITREVVIENNNSNIIYRVRQASTGKILYTATSKDGYEIIDFEYSAKSIWDDRYVIVAHKTEAYDGVTYKLGVLGADGKWVVPLSENNPILKAMKDYASLDSFKDMYYMGEGIIRFENADDYYFYNITKNTATKIQSEIDDYDIRSILQCADEFIDGVTIETYGWGGGFAKITSDGKITRMECNFHEDFHERIGSFYYDKKNDRIIRMGYTYHQDGFSLFDSKGKIIKTLKNVDLVSANGFNDEGIAQLLIQNKEGTKYYTLIDTSGNFLFDPIKTGGAVIDAESNLIIGSGLHMVVDRNGNILYQQEKYGDLSYKNGVVYDEGADEGKKYTLIEK